jgi:hypothetical protein
VYSLSFSAVFHQKKTLAGKPETGAEMRPEDLALMDGFWDEAKALESRSPGELSPAFQ